MSESVRHFAGRLSKTLKRRDMIESTDVVSSGTVERAQPLDMLGELVAGMVFAERFVGSDCIFEPDTSKRIRKTLRDLFELSRRSFEDLELAKDVNILESYEAVAEPLISMSCPRAGTAANSM